MNIGFEAKRFFTNSTGLGNYSRFIVSALSEHYPVNKYFLFTPTDKTFAEADAILRADNISVIKPSNSYKRLKAESIWRTWGIAGEPKTKELNIFHGLSQELPVGLSANIKKVVTIHDLIYLRYPRFYNPIDVQIYKTKVKFACKSADTIIAISQQTASDIVEFLHVESSKIKIIHQGAHASFKRVTTTTEQRAVRKKYNLPDQYILSVGTIEERKNLLALMKAFKALPEGKRIPIVVVGKQTPYTRVVKEFVNNSNLASYVTFLHDAAFSDFPELYQGATLFIYPSIFEGFGIPLIEAIESKIPVITSKGSCFSEAGGPSSRYVNTDDVEEFSSAICEVLGSEANRKEMVEKAYQHIQKFQPAVVARELNSLYQNLVK